MRSFINPSGALFFTKCGPFDNDSSMTNTCASWLWAANKMLRYRFEISMSVPVAQGSIRLEKQSSQRVCPACFVFMNMIVKWKVNQPRSVDDSLLDSTGFPAHSEDSRELEFYQNNHITLKLPFKCQSTVPGHQQTQWWLLSKTNPIQYQGPILIKTDKL